MARIRSIKPSFFRSEDVSVLPLRARLTWIGLWTHCDDAGRTKDNARLIKGDIWPLDDVSLRDIEEDLATLAAHGRIVRYEVDGKRYLEIVNWGVHQSIQKPTPSRIPPPPEPQPDAHTPTSIDSGSPTGALPEPSDTATTRKGKEGKGREGTRAPAREEPPHPPNPDTLHTRDSAPAGNNRADCPEPRGTSTTAQRPVADPSPQAEMPAGPARATTPPPAPPADRCRRHVDDPAPPNCGPCGDARRARERWHRDQLDADRVARSQHAQQHAAAARAAIDACPLCDPTGYTNGQVCHHDPTTPTRARHGAAAARAALTRT